MAEQDWMHANPFAGDSPAVAAPPPPARYELRPLAVGEILDRIFSLYRSHFWLFVGLSSLAAGVSVVFAILRLVYLHFFGVAVASSSAVVTNSVLSLIQAVLYLVAYGYTSAASTFAVQALYLGQPTEIRTAVQMARRFWLRCLGIGLWQGWSAMWVFMVVLILFGVSAAFAQTALAVLLGFGMFASLIYGVIAYLRNSLAVPAAVVEDTGVRAAMRRSKTLAQGTTGRIFLLLLLIYAMWMIAALIEMPLAVILARTPASQHYLLQGIILTVNFFATSLVGPIGAIGLCLFYFDSRIRREGFDIEMLLLAANPAAAGLAAAPVGLAELPGALPEAPEQI